MDLKYPNPEVMMDWARWVVHDVKFRTGILKMCVKDPVKRLLRRSTRCMKFGHCARGDCRQEPCIEIRKVFRTVPLFENMSSLAVISIHMSEGDTRSSILKSQISE